MSRFVYLDYQATTPVDPLVFNTMVPFFSEKYGNPASPHLLGLEAHQAVEQSRKKIAEFFGARPREIFFNSGATEGNNLAIKGIARSKKSGHIITTSIEHKCVLNTCLRLQNEGFVVSYLPVNNKGVIDLDVLKKEIRNDTCLISVMHSNNEIGSLQPILEIGELARRKGIVFHCDATQSVGLFPINVVDLNIDLLTFSSHKIYGPKGIGVLYVRNDLLTNHKIICEIDGGGQERGLRSGTLNVAGIAGLQKAVELVKESQKTEQQRLKRLRTIFVERLIDETECQINTPLESSLPHCLNLSFPGVDGQKLVGGLGNLAVSTGSACNTGSQRPSYVLQAIGVSNDLIQSSIRLSVGRFTTEDEVDFAVKELITAVRQARTYSRVA